MELNKYVNNLGKWYERKTTKNDISESGYIYSDECAFSINVNLNGISEYLPAYGDNKLITVIKQKYNIKQNEVLVTNGVSEGMNLVLNAIIKDKDEVIVIEPYYINLSELIGDLGGVYDKIDIDADNFNIINNIYDHITPKTKLIIMNFPNNPLGVSMPIEQKINLIKYAAERNIYIVCDDIFMDFNPSPSYVHIDYWNVISLNSVSKVYGAPSLRVGWIIANEKIIKNCVSLKDWLNISTSALPQEVAVQLLNDTNLITTIRANVANNRNFLNDLLKNSANFKIVGKGTDGCCALIEYNNRKKQISSTEFCSIIYNTANILIAPGDLFGYPFTFRLGFGMDHKIFQEIFLQFYQAAKNLID